MRVTGRPIACIGLVVAIAALCPGGSGAGELRHGRRFGVSLGLLAEPVPSIISTEVSYDLDPRWRLFGAIGGGIQPDILVNGSWTTYGFGARYFFLPQKRLSPMIGASMNYSKLEYDVLFGFAHGEESTSSGGICLALDWQTHAGFDFAAGGNVPLLASGSPFDTAPVIPFVRFGWLF